MIVFVLIGFLVVILGSLSWILITGLFRRPSR
jgi:hypothetical protein